MNTMSKKNKYKIRNRKTPQKINNNRKIRHNGWRTEKTWEARMTDGRMREKEVKERGGKGGRR